MSYQGGIVGGTELNDYWKERMRLNAQKEELKRHMNDELQFIIQLLLQKIDHSNTTVYTIQTHQGIIQHIINEIDGESKYAMIQRFYENNRLLEEIEEHFTFLKDSISRTELK